jgi:hypothetical protein
VDFANWDFRSRTAHDDLNIPGGVLCARPIADSTIRGECRAAQCPATRGCDEVECIHRSGKLLMCSPHPATTATDRIPNAPVDALANSPIPKMESEFRLPIR